MEDMITLYHFTSLDVAIEIIENGFKPGVQREQVGIPEWMPCTPWQRKTMPKMAHIVCGQRGEDAFSFTPGGVGAEPWREMVSQAYPAGTDLAALRVTVPMSKLHRTIAASATGAPEEVGLVYKPTPLGIGIEFQVKTSDLKSITKELVTVEDVMQDGHQDLKEWWKEHLQIWWKSFLKNEVGGLRRAFGMRKQFKGVAVIGQLYMLHAFTVDMCWEDLDDEVNAVLDGVARFGIKPMLKRRLKQAEFNQDDWAEWDRLMEQGMALGPCYDWMAPAKASRVRFEIIEKKFGTKVAKLIKKIAHR